MFEMFEVYGRQITAFITEAKTLLEAIKVEAAAQRAELAEIRTQATRIEVALAAAFTADDEEEIEEEIPPVVETAAVVAAEVATEVAEEVAVEAIEGETEVIAQETVPPAEETPAPASETGTESLPVVPVPDEPIVEPQEIPVEKKNKRHWI